MMDEKRLYRAKSGEKEEGENAEWLFGHYVFKTFHMMGKLEKYPAIEYEREDGTVIREVIDEATLGQSTGERDKKGALIFDGDIVKGEEGYVTTVRLTEDGFKRLGKNGYSDLNPKEQDIVSNIHDIQKNKK
jgi:hypothetical protein